MTKQIENEKFLPFMHAYNAAMKEKNWAPRDLGHAVFPKDAEAALKLAANNTIWSKGKGKPGNKYMKGVKKALDLSDEVCEVSITGIPIGGGKRKSPVNRLAKLIGNGQDLTPVAHRKAQPLLSFQIEADGMARIAFDIRLPLDKAFAVLDQLRQAGVVTE